MMDAPQQIPGDVRGRWFTRYVYEARYNGHAVCARVDCDQEAETPQAEFYWLIVDDSPVSWLGGPSPLYGVKPTAEEAKTEAVEALGWYIRDLAAKHEKPHRQEPSAITPERKQGVIARALGMLRGHRK